MEKNASDKMANTQDCFSRRKKWSNWGYICFVSFLSTILRILAWLLPPSEYLLGKKDETSMFVLSLYQPPLAYYFQENFELIFKTKNSHEPNVLVFVEISLE